MMKMLVDLDIPYNQDEALWQEVDSIFDEQKCSKDKQLDGSVLYTGNLNSNSNFTEFGVLFVKLSDNQKFMGHVKKWILFDNEDDESLPLQETDILKEIREFKTTYRM